jgi:hypothetical protein
MCLPPQLNPWTPPQPRPAKATSPGNGLARTNRSHRRISLSRPRPQAPSPHKKLGGATSAFGDGERRRRALLQAASASFVQLTQLGLQGQPARQHRNAEIKSSDFFFSFCPIEGTRTCTPPTTYGDNSANGSWTRVLLLPPHPGKCQALGRRALTRSCLVDRFSRHPCRRVERVLPSAMHPWPTMSYPSVETSSAVPLHTSLQPYACSRSHRNRQNLEKVY